MDISSLSTEELQEMLSSIGSELQRRTSTQPTVPQDPWRQTQASMREESNASIDALARQQISLIAPEAPPPQALQPQDEAIFRKYMRDTGWTVNNNVPTEALIRNFQRVNRLEQTGQLDAETSRVLAWGLRNMPDRQQSAPSNAPARPATPQPSQPSQPAAPINLHLSPGYRPGLSFNQPQPQPATPQRPAAPQRPAQQATQTGFLTKLRNALVNAWREGPSVRDPLRSNIRGFL